MSLSARVASHLPYLRRYARALTGSQASGDAYVAATLEALITDVTLLQDAGNDRISLFRLFSELFDKLTIEVKPAHSPFAWEERAAANLAEIPALPRQAFTLVSLEGFSPVEAATILGIDDARIAALLAEAANEISRQVTTDIMIIEDEPLIAMDIQQMVEELGHTITGIARTHSEAVALYNKRVPGMVLADIQLADGSSGIDAVNDILKTSSIPVIFITAFPERLLTGERPEPAFLVTKPFNPEMVKALISQALFFRDRQKTAA